MDKKKTIIAVGIICILVVVFLLLNTYAFWTVKKKQTNINKLSTACLQIDYIDIPDSGINLTEAWPLTDEEGIATTGYTFRVENVCNEPVNYQVVLESLKIDGKTEEDYFGNEYIKLQLSNDRISRYSEFGVVLNDQDDDHKEDIRETRQIFVGTLAAKEEGSTANVASHNIRIWISGDAPNSQIGKAFRSKIKVYAGQGVPKSDHDISPESCFAFDSSTGNVTAYNVEECGTSLVLPATIGGTPIRAIGLTSETKDLTYIDISKASGLKNVNQYAFVDTNSSPYVSVIGGYVGLDNDLVLPENTVTVGDNAFSKFNGNNLVLNNKLEFIGGVSFGDYQGLGKNLILPSSVSLIGPGAFYSFNGAAVVLSSNLSQIMANAFYSYEGLNSPLVIPNNVVTIEENAFRAYSGPSLALSSKLKTINNYAFENYNGTRITIPNSVEEIGDGAFYKYNNSANLELGTGVNKIGSHAFYSYEGVGTTLDFPSSLTEIGNYAFFNYLGDTINFNEGLSKIGEYAFYNYYKQNVIVYLPSTITEIKAHAFDGLDATATIVIKKPNLSGITLESGWNGGASIKCWNNNQVINCPN